MHRRKLTLLFQREQQPLSFKQKWQLSSGKSKWPYELGASHTNGGDIHRQCPVPWKPWFCLARRVFLG